MTIDGPSIEAPGVNALNGHGTAASRADLALILRLLAKGPPERLLARAALGLADPLLDEGEVQAAVDEVTAELQGAPATLAWKTAAELRRETPERVDYVHHGYLARNAISLLAGKAKAGKSTYTLALATAIVSEDAHEFLGAPVVTGHVVYVSEEGAATLRHKLPDTDRLTLLSREGAWPKPEWSTLVAAAAQRAVDSASVLLVIDTFAYWAGFGTEREQDAGAVGEAMAALTAAARRGVAVLLVHHQPKAGGSDGDAVRGSSAIAGAVDAILELERLTDNDAPDRHGSQRLTTRQC